MSPKKKDWRKFEERREDAHVLNHGVQGHQLTEHAQNHQNPNFYDYDNYGYELRNEIYEPGHGGGSNLPTTSADDYYYDHQPIDHVTPTSYSTYTSGPKYHQEESPIQKNRKCRDVICLGFLFAAIVLMFGVTGYAIVEGDLTRLTNGVDRNCDICGIENKRLHGIANSGKDLSDSSFLFTQKVKVEPSIDHGFRFPADYEVDSDIEPLLDKSSSKIRLRECRTQCPPTYKVVLNRCVRNYKGKYNQSGSVILPMTSRFIKFEDVTDAVEDASNFFQEVGSDLVNSWQDLLWMCLISLGVAVLVTVLLRLFAAIIIWVLVFVVGLTALGSSIGLWAFWLTKHKDQGTWTDTQMTYLMTAAIIVSIISVILVLVLLFMRKRIALVIRLFNEAGKAVHAMPLIILQPLVTFLALGIALGSWLVIAILIESSGSPTMEGTSNGGITAECQFKKDSFTLFSRWWNLFMITWMTQFVLGCQHLIVAGAVSIWFFTRDKRKIEFPIALSYARLLRYHLGSIAFGSLIVAIVKMIRYILNTVQKRLGGTNVICKGLAYCCQCFIWCLEKFLIFLNRNAYIEIAIHGYGFCKSAKKAFNVIVNNALRLAAINSIGDFVLFLAKISIVVLTVFIGHELIKNKNDIHHIWVPLTLGGIFAYFVAHCFISVYEMAIDTVFICFCEDCEINDGLEKPYYMSKSLMEFVKNSEKVDHKTRKERKK